MKNIETNSKQLSLYSGPFLVGAYQFHRHTYTKCEYSVQFKEIPILPRNTERALSGSYCTTEGDEEIGVLNSKTVKKQFSIMAVSI